MSINVNLANAQANQLSTNISQLSQAKNNLEDYKNSLNSNWQADEMSFINQAIDRIMEQINSTMNAIDSLVNDVRDTAAEIKREEDAARAARIRQEKINRADENLNNAKTEAEGFRQRIEEAQMNMNDNSEYENPNEYQDIQDSYNNALQIVDELQEVLNSIK